MCNQEVDVVYCNGASETSVERQDNRYSYPVPFVVHVFVVGAGLRGAVVS